MIYEPFNDLQELLGCAKICNPTILFTQIKNQAPER